MPSSCLASVDPSFLEGATVVHLDQLGRCSPAVGSLMDDGLLLPCPEALLQELEAAREGMQGPTDFGATARVVQAVQQWYGRVLGQFSRYVGKDLGLGQGVPGDDGAVR